MKQLYIFEACITLCGLLLLALIPKFPAKVRSFVRRFVLYVLGCLGVLLAFKIFYFMGFQFYFHQPVTSAGQFQGNKWTIVQARVVGDPYILKEGRAVSICRDEHDEFVDGGFSHDAEFLEMADRRPVHFAFPFSRVATDWNWHEEGGCRFLKLGDQVIVGAHFRGYSESVSAMSTKFVFRGTYQEFLESAFRRDGIRMTWVGYLVSFVCLLVLSPVLRVRWKS